MGPSSKVNFTKRYGEKESNWNQGSRQEPLNQHLTETVRKLEN